MKVRHGGVKALVEATGYSKPTVISALNFGRDTDAEEEIRRMACEMGLLRRF